MFPMSNGFQCKNRPPVTPSDTTYTTPGTYTFTVPYYNTVTVECWGGGGGSGCAGSAAVTFNSTDGEDSWFRGYNAGDCFGQGGKRGSNAIGTNTIAAKGVGGVAGGNTTQLNGSDATTATSTTSGAGGASGDGSGTGGAGRTGAANGTNGNAPGGGAGGAHNNVSGYASAGGGGGGGYAKSVYTYPSADLVVGDTITFYVANGGTRAGNGQTVGGFGANGQIRIQVA